MKLHGATPGVAPLTPTQALSALLRDLGVEPLSIPEHPDAASALLRSMLAPARVLLVLDDAASAAQVRPLLPAGPGCAVIVTSRSPLTALDGARRFPLGPLTGEDSAALLRVVSGREGLDDALALTDQALDIWRLLGNLSWIRRCLNNRGLLLEGLGRFAESESALRQSLEYSRQLDDPYGEAVTYSHLGNLYEHTDPLAAIEQHRRSLAIGDAIGAVIVQHSARCNIGYAHLTLGEPGAAAQHFEESLRILGGHGDWHGESQTRLGLVRALRQLGESERAARECAELLRRADARADRYMGGLARHQHGLLLCGQGRRTEAYEAWRAALAALNGTDEHALQEELRALLES